MSDEDWKAEETNKTDKSFKDARASYAKPFDEEGLTEDDKLFGVDPYYLKGSEKKLKLKSSIKLKKVLSISSGTKIYTKSESLKIY